MLKRLTDELTIPVCSPLLEGMFFTRADWVNASDISRIDDTFFGAGITAAKKTAIVCRAFAVKCELHMVLSAASIFSVPPQKTLANTTNGIARELDAIRPSYLKELS